MTVAAFEYASSCAYQHLYASFCGVRGLSCGAVLGGPQYGVVLNNFCRRRYDLGGDGGGEVLGRTNPSRQWKHPGPVREKVGHSDTLEGGGGQV